MARLAAAALVLLLLGACTNNPHPEADGAARILYRPLSGPPKSFDPALPPALFRLGLGTG